MQVIIIGNNRAEICKVKLQDLDKHFFQTRGQLYTVMPDGLTRIDYIDLIKEKTTSDECIIYAENEIVPYLQRECDYRLDTQLRYIDEHKLMRYVGLLGRAQIFFTKAGNIGRKLYPFAGLIIVGGIVGLAWLGVI